MSDLAVQDLLGLPYLPGGRWPGQGLDCFGLVVECCRRAGRPIPDPFTSAAVPMNVREWIVGRLDGWRPCEGPTAGAVVELRSEEQPAHVGYLLNDYEFVHCLSRTGVVIGRIDRDPWRRRIIGWYQYGA